MTSNQIGYQKSASQQLFSIYILSLSQKSSDTLVFESLAVDAPERLLVPVQGQQTSLCAKHSYPR